jgi:tetratricopeptide (TPR) repeat protein
MEQIAKKQQVILLYVALALATLIAYEQVRYNDFVEYDDNVYVSENPQVLSGLTRESIVWAFTTPHAANWHPLTWLSHILDCQLFGSNAGWHHLTNLLLHVANTLLLFGVLKQMTGAIWRSALVAAAFALHPLHVESVAWIAERKDVLSTLFWMLTMAGYLGYVKRPSSGRYLLTLLALALGLMAKPMLVTLPFVLLLLDYWPLGRFPNTQDTKPTNIRSQWPIIYRLVREKIPFFALSLVSSAITFIVQQKAGAVAEIERLAVKFRIANAFVSYINYINKMFYPNNLSVFYPYHGTRLSVVIIYFIELAVVTAIIIYMSRRYRYLAVGWFWYIGTLVPVIGLVQVGSQAMADRYTYVPLIGLFIIIAWGIPELASKWRYRKIGLEVLASVVLAVLLLWTRTQVRYWKNNLTLFGHSIAVTQNNWVMHNNYGKALAEEGQFEEAIKHLNEALRLRPVYFEARNNLGTIFFMQGKTDEAMECFTEALRIRPGQAEAYLNLGSAYGRQGKYDLAIQNYNEAIRLKPYYPTAYYNLGVIMNMQGKHDEAIKYLGQALRLNPNWPGALDALAIAYAAKGNFLQAVETAEKGISIAEAAGQKALADEIRNRLHLYRSGKPYRPQP